MSLSGVIERQLRAKGRPMVLRRLSETDGSPTEVTVQGFSVAFSASDVTGDLRQGDVRITIGPGVGALSRPKIEDQIVDGADRWEVKGSTPLYVGPRLAGYRLWCRGGS